MPMKWGRVDDTEGSNAAKNLFSGAQAKQGAKPADATPRVANRTAGGNSPKQVIKGGKGASGKGSKKVHTEQVYSAYQGGDWSTTNYNNRKQSWTSEDGRARPMHNSVYKYNWISGSGRTGRKASWNSTYVAEEPKEKENWWNAGMTPEEKKADAEYWNDKMWKTCEEKVPCVAEIIKNDPSLMKLQYRWNEEKQEREWFIPKEETWHGHEIVSTAHVWCQSCDWLMHWNDVVRHVYMKEDRKEDGTRVPGCQHNYFKHTARIANGWTSYWDMTANGRQKEAEQHKTQILKNIKQNVQNVKALKDQGIWTQEQRKWALQNKITPPFFTEPQRDYIVFRRLEALDAGHELLPQQFPHMRTFPSQCERQDWSHKIDANSDINQQWYDSLVTCQEKYREKFSDKYEKDYFNKKMRSAMAEKNPGNKPEQIALEMWRQSLKERKAADMTGPPEEKNYFIVLNKRKQQLRAEQERKQAPPPLRKMSFNKMNVSPKNLTPKRKQEIPQKDRKKSNGKASEAWPECKTREQTDVDVGSENAEQGAGSDVGSWSELLKR